MIKHTTKQFPSFNSISILPSNDKSEITELEFQPIGGFKQTQQVHSPISIQNSRPTPSKNHQQILLQKMKSKSRDRDKRDAIDGLFKRIGTLKDRIGSILSKLKMDRIIETFKDKSESNTDTQEIKTTQMNLYKLNRISQIETQKWIESRKNHVGQNQDTTHKQEQHKKDIKYYQNQLQTEGQILFNEVQYLQQVEDNLNDKEMSLMDYINMKNFPTLNFMKSQNIPISERKFIKNTVHSQKKLDIKEICRQKISFLRQVIMNKINLKKEIMKIMDKQYNIRMKDKQMNKLSRNLEIAQKKLKKQIYNNDLNALNTDRKYYKEVKEKSMKKIHNFTLSYQKRSNSQGNTSLGTSQNDQIQIQNGKYNFNSHNQHLEQYFKTHVNCFLEKSKNQNFLIDYKTNKLVNWKDKHQNKRQESEDEYQLKDVKKYLQQPIDLKGTIDKYKNQNRQIRNPILNQVNDLDKIGEQYILKTLQTYEDGNIVDKIVYQNKKFINRQKQKLINYQIKQLDTKQTKSMSKSRTKTNLTPDYQIKRNQLSNHKKQTKIQQSDNDQEVNDSIYKLYEESIQLQKDITRDSPSDIGRYLNKQIKLKQLHAQINKKTSCRLKNRRNTQM